MRGSFAKETERAECGTACRRPLASTSVGDRKRPKQLKYLFKKNNRMAKQFCHLTISLSIFSFTSEMK